jgi:hypothetical protein
VPAPTSAFLSGPDDPVPGARLYAALSSAGLDPSDLGAVGRGRAVSALACRFSVDGTIYIDTQNEDLTILSILSTKT